jgi:hypothetical protein
MQNLYLQGALNDSNNSAGSANSILTSTGSAVQWLPNPISTSTFIVYVNEGGNDSTGNGSVNNPYLTIAHAMSTITYATASQRVIINLGPGTYSSNFSLKANVFIIGSEPIATRLTGTIDINDASWNNANDNRSGFSNCTLVNAITFNFTAQSASAGKLYIYDCWFDGLITMTADSSINQTVLTDCVLFAGWTQNGMEAILNNCDFFGGNITVNSSAATATYCQLDSTIAAGNLVVTSTSAQVCQAYLYSSYIPGTISASGSGATIYYTIDSIPPTGISLSSSATSSNLNAALPISNTYSPTYTLGTNVSAISLLTGNYTQIGNIVNVNVVANITVNGSAVDQNMILTISIPVNTNSGFSSIYSAPGVVNIYYSGGGLTQLGGQVTSTISGNTVVLNPRYTLATSQSIVLMANFQYSITG